MNCKFARYFEIIILKSQEWPSSRICLLQDGQRVCRLVPKTAGE